MPRRLARRGSASPSDQLRHLPSPAQRQPDRDDVRRALQALALTLQVWQAEAPLAEGDAADLRLSDAQWDDKRRVAVPGAGHVAGAVVGGSVQVERGAKRV